MDFARKVLGYYSTKKYTDSPKDRQCVYMLSKAVERDPQMLLGIAKRFVPEIENFSASETCQKRGTQLASLLMKRFSRDDYTFEALKTLSKMTHGKLEDLTVAKYMYRFQLDKYADSILDNRDSLCGTEDSEDEAGGSNTEDDENSEEGCGSNGSRQTKRRTPLHPNAEQIYLIKETIADRQDHCKIHWKHMISAYPNEFSGVPKRTVRNWGYRILQEVKDGGTKSNVKSKTKSNLSKSTNKSTRIGTSREQIWANEKTNGSKTEPKRESKREPKPVFVKLEPLQFPRFDQLIIS